jgi:AraC family transcriptional regulator of adaptative response/methylated-DNA-[protein]-cysteine methyltransferase
MPAPTMSSPVPDDERWAAVQHRDATFDGRFYYSVRTMGVYCRPSCAARRARRENVHFHRTRADAEAAGFRPRKRCRPDETAVTEQLRFGVATWSLGLVLMAAGDLGIRAILLGDDAATLEAKLGSRFPRTDLIAGGTELEPLMAKVVQLVETPRRGLDLPLAIRGTAFQQRVWQALREFPPGAMASYADVAARIGAPKAVRAVAKACAANALAVAIPCHRVVRHDGALSGYRWGAARKQALLDREAHR